MPSFLVAASLALVAWGALAFGAVYPWAWQPLIAGALVVGVAAMGVAWRRGASARGTAVLWALLAVALTASLQLVPLSVSLRQASCSRRTSRMASRLARVPCPSIPR